MGKQKQKLTKEETAALKEYAGMGLPIVKEDWKLLIDHEGLVIFQNQETGRLYYVWAGISGFSMRRLMVDNR